MAITGQKENPNLLFKRGELASLICRCEIISKHKTTPAKLFPYILNIEVACRKLEVFLIDKELEELEKKLVGKKSSILDIEKPNG